MIEKPGAKACPLCGGMIEPYMDSGEWVWSGGGAVALHVVGQLEAVVYHSDCFANARLWRRLRAIEARLEGKS